MFICICTILISFSFYLVNSTNVILKDEAVTTLNCVLSVVYLLWDLSVTYERERQSTGLVS